MSELKHHGILNMKWGQRNGPPYPLDRSISTGSRLRDKTQRKLNKLSKITKKMEKGQKKADKANLKTAKEKSKTFFRNEEKLSKATAKSDKINAKQEKLYLQGKKEFEKLFKEMYENKITVESLSEEHQDLFNKWADAINKDTPINDLKTLSEKDFDGDRANKKGNFNEIGTKIYEKASQQKKDTQEAKQIAEEAPQKDNPFSEDYKRTAISYLSIDEIKQPERSFEAEMKFERLNDVKIMARRYENAKTNDQFDISFLETFDAGGDLKQKLSDKAYKEKMLKEYEKYLRKRFSE